MKEELEVVRFSERLPKGLDGTEGNYGPNGLIGKHHELERICEQENGELVKRMDKDFSAFTSDPRVDYWSYDSVYMVRGAKVTNKVKLRGNRTTTIEYKKGHRPNSLIEKMEEIYKKKSRR